MYHRNVREEERKKKMYRNRSDWSKIHPDLLRSILESLSRKDYHRARTVCSNWYSVSKSCTRPLYPWRILFNENSTFLIDPGEDKIHEIQHRGIDFTKIYVMASWSNWFLIVDRPLNFYLLNVFTRERINLPLIDASIRGQASIFEWGDDWECFIQRSDIISSEKTASLWINERTMDYVVAWSCKKHYLFTYKKGDESWWKIEGTKCIDVAYKDYKLYVLSSSNCIKVFDLSGDCLKELVYVNHPLRFVLGNGEYTWKSRLAVMNSGEVLILVSLKGLRDKRWFEIYKMNLESSYWEKVDSIGSEMLIFGHGVTIRGPVKEINGDGIKSDSICFLEADLCPRNKFYDVDFGVFDLVTSTITSPKSLDVSFSKSLWFVPGYA